MWGFGELLHMLVKNNPNMQTYRLEIWECICLRVPAAQSAHLPRAETLVRSKMFPFGFTQLLQSDCATIIHPVYHPGFVLQKSLLPQWNSPEKKRSLPCSTVNLATICQWLTRSFTAQFKWRWQNLAARICIFPLSPACKMEKAVEVFEEMHLLISSAWRGKPCFKLRLHFLAAEDTAWVWQPLVQGLRWRLQSSVWAMPP